MAIALDATATLNYGATLTWNHTCGAKASVLFAYIRDDGAVLANVTYAGRYMVLAGSIVVSGGAKYYVYYQTRPKPGVGAIVVTGPSNIGAASASYSGTGNAIPEAVATNSGTGLSSISTNLTIAANGCWALLCVADRSGTNPTPGNFTSRATPGGGASMTLFDSNGAFNPGVNTGTAIVSGTAGAIILSFGPGTLVVTVAGTDRAHVVDRESLEITDEIYEQPNIASFECFGFTPAVNDDVVIKIDSRKEFAGKITRIREKRSRLNESRVIKFVQCTDHNYEASSVLFTGRYTGVSATAIATAIYASLSGLTGFTANHIDAGLQTIDEIQFTETPVPDAFSQLCDAFGGGWYFDEDKDLHVFTTDTSAVPDQLDTNNFDWRTFSRDQAIDALFNRILVEGAGSSAVAPVAVGGTIIPVESTADFDPAGGSVLAGPQIAAYTGFTAGAAIVAPVGTWTLTPSHGGGGSLPANTVFTYKIIYRTAAGTTTPSAASGTVNTGGSISDGTVSATFVPTAGTVPGNITGFSIYVSTSSSAGAGPWVLMNSNTAGNVSMMGQLAAGGLSLQHQLVNDAAAAPPSTSTAGSDEMGGSTTSGSTAIGATSLTVVERGKFTSTGGSALVTVNGTPFLITYTGKSSSYGTGTITGIPASGFGSVLYTIPTGSQIQNIPTLIGVTGILYPINAGDDVNLLVQRDDATSQGTYGIRRKLVQDRRLSKTGAQTRGDAELTLQKDPRVTGGYTTTDPKVGTGRAIIVSMSSPWGISATYTIQQVRKYFEPERTDLQRDVTFSSQTLDRDLFRLLRSLQRNIQAIL